MSDPTVPVVDEAYILRVYNDLANMDVELDSDPLRFGPKRLNGKVALCRRHLTRCQQMFLQLSEDLQKINRVHRRSKLDFDLQVQDMFVNDPDTRSGRNVRDREAIASVKLRAEREAISGLESSQEDINAVMSVVKAKREDLKDVQGRIRDQIKLCQEEMGLGGKWGSAPPPGATPVDLDGMRPVFRSQGGVPLVAPPSDSEESEEESEGGISDLEAFIASEVGSSSEYVEAGAEVEEPVPYAKLEGALQAEVLRIAEVDALSMRVEQASTILTVSTPEVVETAHVGPVTVVSVEDFDLDDFLSTGIASVPVVAKPDPVTTPEAETASVACVPEVQELISPEPVVAEQAEPSEPVNLPAINEVQEPSPTVSKAEVDAFFDDLDLTTVTTKPTKSAVADEIDLNDILGGLV